MAQGQFTKEEADAVNEMFGEVMTAFPKTKVAKFLGHFNDIAFFIEAARKVALSEAEVAEGKQLKPV